MNRAVAILTLGALLSSCNDGYIPPTSSGALDDATLQAMVSAAARDNSVPAASLYAMLYADSAATPTRFPALERWA